MILNIYALYDKDAENLNQSTFVATNDKVAKRMLKETLRRDEVLARNAKNYEVHKLGQYDTEAGITANGKSTFEFELEELLGMPEQATPAASAE